MQLVITNSLDIESKRRKKRKSLIGQIVVTLIAAELMCFAAFAAINLPTATGNNMKNYFILKAQALVAILPGAWQSQVMSRYPVLGTSITTVRRTPYTPLAPVAVLLAYILEYPLATLAVSLFVVLGLVGPFFDLSLFACGGGSAYYTQPGFGYYIGMILATIVVSKITVNKRTSLRQALAAFLGIFTAHCVGIAYLLGSCLVLILACGANIHLTWHVWALQYIRNLSFYPLPYDLLLAFLFIGSAFPFKWLAGILTASDAPSSSKAFRINGKKLSRSEERTSLNLS